MGHIAHSDGGIALFRMRNRHHRRILEIIIVAAVPEAFPVGFPGLETDTVERGQFTVVVGDLRAFHLDGNPLPDTADHIVQQFRILVDILGNQIIQVIRRFILHLIKIGIASHGRDTADTGDLAAPDTENRDAKRCQNAEQPTKYFFHSLQMYKHFPISGGEACPMALKTSHWAQKPPIL